MDRESAVAPRDLTSDETSDLRRRLKSELISINSSADDEEDAEVLLDYAMDMVEGGETVGNVVDELKFMGMSVCDEDAANELGARLAKFFAELDGGGGEKNDASGSARERIERRTESEEPPTSRASAAPSGEEETEGGAEAREPPPPPAPGPDRPPARGGSMADRAASFRSSYAPSSGPPPRSPSSSVSSSSSVERTSWVGPQKIPAARSKDEPSDETPKEEEEHEPKEEAATKRISLKDRLAAYQGASSRKFPPEKSNSTSSKDRMTGAKNGSSSPEHDKNEDGDGAPAMSLKERMAAFQGDKSSSLASTKEAGEDEADGKEDDKVIIDDAPKTLKERMAAFQRSKSSLTTTTEEEEEGENDNKDEDAPKSLKDRMSAFQSPPVASAKNEPTVRDRKSAYSPPRRENGSLQDRMSVFGKPKSAPRKRPSDLQQRMAKFNNTASSTNNPTRRKKIPPEAKATPKLAGAVGGDLKDRMAKYAERAGVSDPDAIAARPRPSQFNKKGAKKRRSFATKKPDEKLEARLSVYQPKTVASEGEDGNEAQMQPVTRTGNGAKGRLSMYEATPSKKPIEPALPQEAGNGSEKPAAKEAGALDADKPSLEAAEENNPPPDERAENSKELATGEEGVKDATVPSPEAPEERDIGKEEAESDREGRSSAIGDASSSEAAEERELRKEREGRERECDLSSDEAADPAEKAATEEVDGVDAKETSSEEVEAKDDEEASPAVVATVEWLAEEKKLGEEGEGFESEMAATGEASSPETAEEEVFKAENIPTDETIEEAHDKEAASVDLASVEEPSSDGSREEKKSDRRTSGVDSQEPRHFPAFSKTKSEKEPRDEAEERKNSKGEVLRREESKEEPEEGCDEEELPPREKPEAERPEAEPRRAASELVEAEKSVEEIFHKTQLEVARRAKEAELESILRETDRAEESHRESLALIKTLWEEAHEHKADVRKAKRSARSLEAKMKKGGLPSKGRKALRKEYKNALDVVRRRELGLLGATDRLAAAQQEVRIAFLRVEDCRRRREGARRALARLWTASDGAKPWESATSPPGTLVSKGSATRATTDSSAGDGADDAFVYVSI